MYLHELYFLDMACADIVMHSATKFIAGHSDVMAGVLAVKGERCALYKLKSIFIGRRFHSYKIVPSVNDN